MPAKKTSLKDTGKASKKSISKSARKVRAAEASKSKGSAVKKGGLKTAGKTTGKASSKTTGKASTRAIKKTSAKKTISLSGKKLRDITWLIGHTDHSHPENDHIALLMIRPRQGHLYWHVTETSFEKLLRSLGDKADHTSLVIRIHDVSDIIFNGTNAHTHIDLHVKDKSGNYYFSTDFFGRDVTAEIGIKCSDNSFHSIVRSGTAFFEHERASGNYCTEGIFAGGSINRTFSIENIFDAPIYEKMNRELSCVKRHEPLTIAKVYLDISESDEEKKHLQTFIEELSDKVSSFGVNSKCFTAKTTSKGSKSIKNLTDKVHAASQPLLKKLSAEHKKKPFHIIHCHDWYSSKVGIVAADKLGIPMVLTLHSVEFERAGSSAKNALSKKICSTEQEAVKAASLVIVPHSSTRQQVISLYNAWEEKVVIIPHLYDENPEESSFSLSRARQLFGINQNERTVMFAGELSHASGADIMVEALPTVCRNHGNVNFLFAGEGPLKKELEQQAHHSGIGHKCRFFGHVPSKDFESLLTASDFIVIPSRTWQDEGLAQMAIAHGKPVLTTQQAGIGCIKHGENGLVTFDNPGSIVWGIQELLSNPLNDTMLLATARKNAFDTASIDTIAAQHYMYYEILLKNRGADDD